MFFNGGRLTLSSGTPVPVSDLTAQGTLFWTPYASSLISLSSGGRIVTLVQAEVSIALTGISTTAPTDVYGFLSAGALALELLVWTNDTTRATAVVAPDLTTPFWTKSGDRSRRLLGTVYGSAANVSEFSEAKRYVQNAENLVGFRSVTSDATASWTQAADAWAAMNAGNAAWRVDFVRCLDLSPVEFIASVTCTKATATQGNLGVGLDSTTAVSADCVTGTPATSANALGQKAIYRGFQGIGKHFLSGLQGSEDANTATFFGTAGRRQEGVSALIPC